jgi:abortive infection bacteriophage resistance protein
VNRAAEAEGWIRHRDYTPEARQECFRLVQNLELWSIVDGLSLGTLSRFITECDNRENSTDRVWKLIANDLGVAKAVFPTNIMSLTVLRNTVAHHARLWMRPATQAPKQPKVFAKRLRRADHKSMLVAFYNLALFQGPEGYRDFADRVDALVSADPVYAYGVQKVHHHSDPDRSV